MSAASLALRERLAKDIQGWEIAELHRTGTLGDRRSAEWLVGLASAAGPPVALHTFPLQRWVPGQCEIRGNGRVATGVPLFDGGTTGPEGVSAPLAALPCASANIGLGALGGDAGDDNRLVAEARAAGKHPALVSVARMNAQLPGLALQNADRFTTPFGPPVLQVDTEHEPWLRALAKTHEPVQVIVDVAFQSAEAFNVETRVAGSQPGLAPLVVMTPKSSWWQSTAERGGGIAIWLALLRHFVANQPRRDVAFVATSGHELGHLGLDHFLETNAELRSSAHVWMHLGANFAARDSRPRLQASDAALQALALEAMAAAGAPPPDLAPLGQRPGGEARNIHDLGGRYISFLGTNPWFHHPDDRWPDTVDVDKASRLAAAAIAIANRLAT